MTTYPATMSPQEARNFRTAHDAEARRLTRMSKAQLQAEYAGELAYQGTVSLYGGPSSKDELVSAVLHMRYPLDRLNEAIHVMHHTPEFRLDVCEWCAP